MFNLQLVLEPFQLSNLGLIVYKEKPILDGNAFSYII